MKCPVLAAFLLAICAAPLTADAQATPPSADVGVTRMTYGPFLAQVGKANLELAAQRANLSIAEAQITIARVFPDPQLTAGVLQYDISGQHNPTESLVTLSVPIQVGGQRGARIGFAEASYSAAQADLAEFLRNLRASAADAFIDAIHARHVLDRKRQTLASLERLVAVNTERLKAGDVGEVVLVQSRVEAQQFRAEVLDAEGGVRTADLAALVFLGTRAKDLSAKGVQFEGDIDVTDRKFDAATLIAKALAQRPDLAGARRRLDAAQKQTSLTRANRIPDIAIGGTWQHNFSVSATSTPSSDFLGASLTVPLPFSKLYHGDLDAAYAGEAQARALAQAAVIHVEVEVRQALAKYEAAAARVKIYTSGVLKDADAVLDKTLYNYQRGGATLVEVLVAQRTVNDVYLSYYDALADAAHALVAVQQAAASMDERL